MEIFNENKNEWITLPTDQIQLQEHTDLNKVITFRIRNNNDIKILNKFISDIKDVSLFVNGISPFYDQYNPISGHHYATGSGTFPNKI